jgi:hypothetical protein
MGITVSKLDELATTDVTSALALVTQLVQEKNPDLDVRRGVLHDLVLYFSAILAAAKDTEIARVRSSMSLKAINADPTLADTDLVDAVLSNFRVTRKVGAKATGQITIVLDKLLPTTIVAGARFTTLGQVFITERAFAARTDAAFVVSTDDVVIAEVGAGTYSFTISVIAENTGASDTVLRGTAFAVAIPPAHLSRAFAAADFVQGTSIETNQEFIARFESGIAAKTWSNRSTITALIIDQAQFEDIVGTSIVGMGDAEMFRDQHSLLPISYGGRTDVYVRSQALPLSTTKTVTATLVATVENGGVWQFSVARDDVPGFYEVARVALASAAATDTGYEVTTTTRSFDISGTGFKPDIETAQEAAFSSFQTATVQFLDTNTSTAALTINQSTQSYSVTFRGMPLISEIQEFLDSRSVRNPAGDVLVRGAVPCFLTVNFSLRKRSGAADPNVNAIRLAVAAAVNKLEFPGELHASLISDAIQDNLDSSVAIAKIDLLGRILRPDGTKRIIRDNDVLDIPDEPALGVSGRTVAFLLDPQNIGITIETVDAPTVI